MSRIDAYKFIARVANDETLVVRMVTGSDAEIQRIAANMGLSFTTLELRSALGKALDSTELSAAELETVVGGVGSPLRPEQRDRLGRLLVRIDPGLDSDQIRSQSQIP